MFFGSRWLRALSALLISLIALNVTARAATRNVVFIVEEPFTIAGAPPSNDQIQHGLELPERLSERIRQLHLDSITLTDGRSAIEPPLRSVFEDADIVIQIEISESSLGFRVDAQIFNKQESRWIGGVRKSFRDEPALDLEADIAKAIIPPIFVRALEEAQPATRPIMFADCLISAENPVAGRVFSSRYAKALQDSDYFRQTFAVVPLISNVLPKYYKWWCLDLDIPRPWTSRADTAIIFGAIDAEGPPDNPQLVLSLELQRRDRSYVSPEMIVLDVARLSEVLKQIQRAAENLANEP